MRCCRLTEPYIDDIFRSISRKAAESTIARTCEMRVVEALRQFVRAPPKPLTPPVSAAPPRCHAALQGQPIMIHTTRKEAQKERRRAGTSQCRRATSTCWPSCRSATQPSPRHPNRRTSPEHRHRRRRARTPHPTAHHPCTPPPRAGRTPPRPTARHTAAPRPTARHKAASRPTASRPTASRPTARRPSGHQPARPDHPLDRYQVAARGRLFDRCHPLARRHPPRHCRRARRPSPRIRPSPAPPNAAPRRRHPPRATATTHSNAVPLPARNAAATAPRDCHGARQPPASPPAWTSTHPPSPMPTNRWV
jgi:hypothetical protein